MRRIPGALAAIAALGAASIALAQTPAPASALARAMTVVRIGGDAKYIVVRGTSGEQKIQLSESTRIGRRLRPGDDPTAVEPLTARDLAAGDRVLVIGSSLGTRFTAANIQVLDGGGGHRPPGDSR